MSLIIAPKIIQVDEDKFEIDSFNPKKPNEKYTVTIVLRDQRTQLPILGACTCPHFEFRGVQCKHIAEVIKSLVT